MSTHSLRVTPRSLVAPADLRPFRAAVVELPPDESVGAIRLLSMNDVRRRLGRFRLIAPAVTREGDRA